MRAAGPSAEFPSTQISAARRRPRDRRATILAAAAELFAASGFAAVGIDDIGARVGITGPAIYRHFTGKDALLEAVLLETVAAFALTGSVPGEGLGRVVGHTVVTALDRPAQLGTYVRERHRLVGDRRRLLGAAERRLFRPWHDAVRIAAPYLDDSRMASRRTAVLAMLGAVAAPPTASSRPQLDGVLIDSIVTCLLTAPPPVQPEPTVARAWRPPVPRRDRILTAALELFRDRGFHGVGIDEIGASAGITGPTVYFHYDSKVDILLDAYERAGTRVVAGVHDALTGAASARDALERLARSYVDVAVDNVDLIVVTGREGHALPEAERARLSRRRRDVRDAWVAVLRELRPELSESTARTLVRGVYPLMNQLAQGGQVPVELGRLAAAFVLGSSAQLPASEQTFDAISHGG